MQKSCKPGVRITNLGIRFNLDKKVDTSIKKIILKPWSKRQERIYWGLRGVNLEFKTGEIVGIIGPNGSGKSTLLRAIAGIYTPDEGVISCTGKVALLAIGAGFQPELTGIENICLVGSMYGFSQEAMNELLPRIVDFADIGEFIYQPTRTYSSGMVSRLGFAIVVQLDPDILLIDEILAVGDQAFREKCIRTIKQKYLRGDKIVLFVSHDRKVISEFCNRIVTAKKTQTHGFIFTDEVG